MKSVFICVILLFSLISEGYSQESYKNSSLLPEQRAEYLLKELTLEEKITLMMDESKPIEKLGIKPYNWWNEALHGVARAGLATVFPQAIGMASSFDSDAVYRVFTAVSDEARAKNTYYSANGSYQRYQGLTMWTPNVNIFRDPRWGRGMETYGEDPYLSSIMGTQVVTGLQGPSGRKYDKLHACAKHFAVHSGPEWNRHSFNAENISHRDLYETYLPAFETLVKKANVKEVMCAYNRFEGEPCCGSNRLLIDILRNKWDYKGIVVSDCWAINDFFGKDKHNTHPDAASAAADAVLAGTDLECGSTYSTLLSAVKRGLILERDIDVSVKRLLKARFELGEMDDPEEVSWTKIPYSVVGSAAHDSLALDMARKSIVLLENKADFLPLKRGGLTVAVMGPNANDSVMQWGNYNGTPPRTTTILEGIRLALNPDDKLIYEPACSWVETTVKRSVFDQCSVGNKKGFTAHYWNNLKREGAPVTKEQITTPFRFCTSGATVFAPGVQLRDFSATYTTTFSPIESGEVSFDFYSYGKGRLFVNDKMVAQYVNEHGAANSSHKMSVERGKPYDIRIEFEYTNGDAQLNFDIELKEEVNSEKTLARVKDADVIVFVGGISPFLEGEEMGVDLPGFKKGDRTNIKLPDVQKHFIEELNKIGKDIVFVNCSGAAIALEEIRDKCQSILQAWYPGQAGGRAVADVLFGDYNPAGRLPVTFYDNDSQLPDFEDYNMNNRTYRYMSIEPAYPFGHGLSYSTFLYGEATMGVANDELSITIPVTNTSNRGGDEVVQVYVKRNGDALAPIKSLQAFQRVHIGAGESKNVTLKLGTNAFKFYDQSTDDLVVKEGDYTIYYGGSSAVSKLKDIEVDIKR